jgi:hypothetical protein
MVTMRDKIRNITPFKHGPAQTQEELNGQPEVSKAPQTDKQKFISSLVDGSFNPSASTVITNPTNAYPGAKYKAPVYSNISVPEDDTIFQKVSTLVSNPFDGAIALANQTMGGIQNLVGIDQGRRDGPYGSLTSLRRAKAATDAETKKELSRTRGFNIASQIALLRGAYGGTKVLSNALKAQTNAELISGNPVSAILSKVKASDIVKNVAPLYATAKTAYYGYKGGNMAYGNDAENAKNK